MEWVDTLQKWWWVIVTLLFIIYKFSQLSVRYNKSKESVDKVANHDKDITDLKKDLTGIKEAVEKQAEDTSAMLRALQSMMNCMYNTDCGIGPARDQFNEYLSKR